MTMIDITSMPPEESARISYHMGLFGLDSKTQFKGELVVPAGRPMRLEYETKTSGTHALVSPGDLDHAKAALGIPDSAYAGAKPYNRFSDLRMVSPEKSRNALTQDDITQMHQAARAYIYGESSKFKHFKNAINKHMTSNLSATVYVYTQLDVSSPLTLVGNGNPVVLIVHTLNIHPGGSISTDGSPLDVNVTVFNAVKSTNTVSDTDYDVIIDLGVGTKGADGSNQPAGASQPKAADGKNGSTSCCSGGTSPEPGNPGQAGGNGNPGTNGMPGGSISEAAFFVTTLNCNVHVVATGGAGGKGGNGGDGGKGGDGGNGGTGNGTAAGGAGGNGGNGGDGGLGGSGGNGGTVCLYVENMTTKIFDAEVHGGTGGTGGTGGNYGAAGIGGTGNPNGANGLTGAQGTSKASGATGADGQIIIRQSTPPSIDGFSPNTGPIAGGTRLDILGSNFYKDSTGASIMEFRINNVQMTDVEIVSTLQARATTPASSAVSAYPIVVINKETMAAGSSAQNFVYTAE